MQPDLVAREALARAAGAAAAEQAHVQRAVDAILRGLSPPPAQPHPAIEPASRAPDQEALLRTAEPTPATIRKTVELAAELKTQALGAELPVELPEPPEPVTVEVLTEKPTYASMRAAVRLED